MIGVCGLGENIVRRDENNQLATATLSLKVGTFVHFPSELLLLHDLLNITTEDSSFTKNSGAWVPPVSPGSIDPKPYVLSRASLQVCPQTGSISITWELVSNENSQDLPQTFWTRNSGVGLRNLCLTKSSRWLWCTNAQEPLPWHNGLNKVIVNLAPIDAFLGREFHLLAIIGPLFSSRPMPSGWRRSLLL